MVFIFGFNFSLISLISLNTNFDITKCKFQALYVLLESMSLNCTFVENHECYEHENIELYSNKLLDL